MTIVWSCAVILSKKIKYIGGPSLTVEMYKVKFLKRINNRDKLVDGVYVLGRICRETKDYFLIWILRRGSATLIPLIKKNLLVRTTIIRDY